MNKKEFYLLVVIVIFTYLAIIFQVNLKNFATAESDNDFGNFNFNAYSFD